MELEDITEVKECDAQSEVNDLLNQGNWRLLDFKIEKLRIPVGEVKVGRDFDPFGERHNDSDRFEIKYEDKLIIKYVVGKYK